MFLLLLSSLASANVSLKNPQHRARRSRRRKRRPTISKRVGRVSAFSELFDPALLASTSAVEGAGALAPP